MSFILDALKKLEQKRQRGSVPDLMTVHIPEPQEQKKRPVWPYLLLAALLINAVVFTAWLRPWRSEPGRTLPVKQNALKASPPVSVNKDTEVKSAAASPPVKNTVKADKKAAAPRSADTEKPAPAAASVLVKKEQPESGHVSVQEELPASKPDRNLSAPDNQKVTAAPAVSTARQKPIDRAPVAKAPVPAETAQGAAPNAVPELSQLPENIQVEIPPLSILGHIYSDSSVTRMVNINGDLLREGDTVVKNLTVDQITENGVIFSYKGQRFRMRAF